VIGKGGTCGGEEFGSCRLYVKYILLSRFLFPPRYAKGRVLALAATAIGLGIARAGTFGVSAGRGSDALELMGSCSRRLSHPRDRGAERVLLSRSLCPSDPDSYPINAAGVALAANLRRLFSW
jgi:hypothetical protein